MSGEVEYRGVVYPWQCDHMGHMNVRCHMDTLARKAIAFPNDIREKSDD